MALDLYHWRVNGDRRGEPVTVYPDVKGFAELMQRFAPMRVTIFNEETDWDAMFADHGLDAAHYVTAGAAEAAAGPRGRIAGYYAFTRRAEAPADAPAMVVFNTLGRDDSLLLDRARARHTTIEALVLRGPPVLHRVAETALFCERMGYRQNAVARAFYERFRPEEYVLDIAQVRAMHDLAEPETRAEFAAQFLDTWTADSFVQVSY